MKSYKQFISEMQPNVPVVSIDRQYVNIHHEEGLLELNKNLEIRMSTGFSDLREALNKIRKILSMYALKFPKEDVIELDKKNGEFSFPVSYADIGGMSYKGYTAPGTETSNKFNLIIKYNMEKGVYNVSAEVVPK